MDKSIVYVDMDDVLCDYATAYKKALTLYPEITYPQSQPNFFLELIPLPGALSTFNYLLASSHYEPYILTAPSVENPLCYTEKRLWVERHLSFEVTNRLIICPNKGLLKGDILIDDWDVGRGQENFEGVLIKFGSTEYPNWHKVNEYLQALESGLAL